MKIAIIGTYLPRKCGIATFTHDLYKSLHNLILDKPGIIAISDSSESIFPKEVKFIIKKDDLQDYQTAAKFINENYDTCIIQHEYGIFGGNTGYYIVELLKMLHIPVITNLHTVLKHPTPSERTVVQQLDIYSDKLTVMTQSAIDMLLSGYSLSDTKIKVIPHGIPEFTLSKMDAKEMLSLKDTKVMLSFGFLGPNKGYETAIEAVANVKETNFVYLILGTTHPDILRRDGEEYRTHLEKMVIDLGLEQKVLFINEFATEELLLSYLKACDIFVSPYPNENQISSGTLTFALGAGSAVISTPYWYALDLLAKDRGLLFNFGDSVGLAQLINLLLSNEKLLQRYSANAARYGQNMQWPRIGIKLLKFIDEIFDEKAVTQTIPSLFPVNYKQLSS